MDRGAQQRWPLRVRPVTRDALSYQPGEVVGDRYRITGVLGRGGFGAVYAAEHLGTEQPVAVKMMSPPAHDTEAVERFLREARITAGLQHRNTVRVFDVGRAADGPLYMVMEMLRGPTLEQVLQNLAEHKRPMTEAEAIDVAAAILKSLTEAHVAGLVHRDLKPANIMIHRAPGLPDQVKVLDFGCSHSADSTLTGEGVIVGTPGYMSPEQCRSDPVDPRTDLYAVGIILFRCVTLRLPYEDKSVLALMYRQANEPPPNPGDVAPQPLSPAFSALVLRALSAEPADRFANATEMRKAFEGHLGSLVNAATMDSRAIPVVSRASAESGVLLANVVNAANVRAETVSRAPVLELPTTDQPPINAAADAATRFEQKVAAVPTLTTAPAAPAPVVAQRSFVLWAAAALGLTLVGAAAVLVGQDAPPVAAAIPAPLAALAPAPAAPTAPVPAPPGAPAQLPAPVAAVVPSPATATAAAPPPAPSVERRPHGPRVNPTSAAAPPTEPGTRTKLKPRLVDD